MIAYEAAVLRYRPDAFAGEFANVGVFLVARDEAGRIVDVRGSVHRSSQRLSVFFSDLWSVESYSMWRTGLNARISAIKGHAMKDALAQMAPGYFEELCSEIQKDTGGIFSWGKTINGVAESATEAFDSLIGELVTRNIKQAKKYSLSDRELWENVFPQINDQLQPLLSVHGMVEFDAPLSHDESDRIHMRWRNGSDQFLEPLSFQVLDSDTITDKGQRMTGRLFQMTKKRPAQFKCTILLAPPTDEKLKAKAEKQLDLIKQTDVVREVIQADQLGRFLEEVRSEAKPIG